MPQNQNLSGMLYLWKVLVVPVRRLKQGKLCIGFVVFLGCFLLLKWIFVERTVDSRHNGQETGDSRWDYCQTRISSTIKSRPRVSDSDELIFRKYASKSCSSILTEDFVSREANQSEREFPIAYVLVVYKGADLLEKLLQAIYMPHNVYCIHVDKKVWKTFGLLVRQMTKCLENVFLVKKPVDVIWGHVSVLQSQVNCMEDLLGSSVKWKYAITLVGQDFPLYDNENIVQALRNLGGVSNLISAPVHESFSNRTRYVHLFIKRPQGSEHFAYDHIQTPHLKSPPPYNITLYKGSNHVALTRAFVEYVVHDTVAINFLDWLSDSFIPDEFYFASLQRYVGSPQVIPRAQQSHWIMRALRWWYSGGCYGSWVRELCWVTIQDLRWVLSKMERMKLFVHKIPFDYDEDLLMCLSESAGNRSYGQYFYP